MIDPICFTCKHFKQYQPLTFVTPGKCGWEPREAVPEWLRSWLAIDEYYDYGPDRDVSTRVLVKTECPAFERVDDD